MRTYNVVFGIVATLFVHTAAEAGTGRWKWDDRMGCVWAAEDDGGNQCEPGQSPPEAESDIYNLSFVVRDAVIGKAICAVSVQLDRESGNGSSRNTDCGGFANFGLSSGTVNFTLSAPGFETYNAEMDLRQHATLYLALVPTQLPLEDGDERVGDPMTEDSNNGSGGIERDSILRIDMDSDAQTPRAAMSPYEAMLMPLNATKELTVIATSSEAASLPIPNVRLRLRLITLPIGHDHEPMNGPVRLRLASLRHDTCDTGPTGEGCRVRLSTHGIAAAIGFLAEMVDAPYTRFEIKAYINAGVFGMQRLEDYAGSFVLVGKTQSHQANHYCQPEFCAAVVNLANAYSNRWNRVLALNDASLIRGGLFDYLATWATPHVSHRDGKNVDVRANGGENSLPADAAVRAWFRQAATAAFGRAPLFEGGGTSGEHYHLQTR